MIVSRIFSIDDQHWFASVSGDSNPLHVDLSWAKAHFPGRLVVHGQHLLLWALDQLAAARPHEGIASIDATYLKPVVVGDQVDATVDETCSTLRLAVRRETVMVARIRFGERRSNESHFKAGQPLSAARPRAREEFAGLAGAVALPLAADDLSLRFPAIASMIGTDRVKGLAAISTLVGMECPGLRSLLSEISVTIEEPGVAGYLSYRVKKLHEAMSLVETDVTGLGIAGTVMAFTHSDGVAQAPADTIRAMVSPAEFKGQRPLVIGASSGLGAATARLLAAGGANPLLTWHSSGIEDTAAAVRTLGGSGDSLRLDACAPAAGLADLRKAGWQGEQIYYFAAPRIFRRRLEPFQKADLQDFIAVFVDGFYEIVRELSAARSTPLTIFYPSSVAIDETSPELLEYAMAKANGERLCRIFERKLGKLRIVVARLPRISTRQTETFLKVKADAPETTMLPHVRTVQSTIPSSPI